MVALICICIMAALAWICLGVTLIDSKLGKIVKMLDSYRKMKKNDGV
jgi:hypothetical protein